MQPKKLTNILLFGETGNGKSTLGNYLLGDDVFKVSDDVKSETKVTFGRQGKGDSSDLFVIDTPGLQDSGGADRGHMIQLIQYVKEHKELNAIIVVFNYQQVRFPYNIQTMLKLFCNIFPMKDVGKHIALLFTNSFTKRGTLTNEQKLAKTNKILPEFKRVIKEASGSDLPNNIPTAFVDMDPEEGIDENGKIDLERIKAWANFLPNLNVEEFKAPEPEVKIESQDFEEMRIEGEDIFKTIIKKEREAHYHLDGTITYGEWIEKERGNEEKVVIPEVERIKQLNLDKEEELKRIKEENEKKIKELKEENEKIQKNRNDEYQRIINEQMSNLRMILNDIEKKNENKSEKTLKQKYQDIINQLEGGPEEEQSGECKKGKNMWKAGIVEINDFVKEEKLLPEESTFKGEKKMIGYVSNTLTKDFKDKMIVGWKLKSNYKDGEGGSWEINSPVIRRSSYSFYVCSEFRGGCNWELRIWTMDKKFKNDYGE